MSKLLTALITLAVTLAANGQNYKVLQPEVTALYKNTNGTIFGLRVDSLKILASDTTFFLLKNLQQKSWDCFDIEGSSWMGDKVTLTSEGETVFYNAYSQPIFIKPLAGLNEEWICFSRPELSIRAGITALGTNTILALTDSVKTISFQALNSNGEPVNHEINNFSLLLSKNHGIIKTLNFFNFPDITLGYIMQQLDALTLCGFDSPATGIQNLTWKEVNNHQPGDELHTVYEYTSIYYSMRNETITRFLDRIISGDTIIYHTEQKLKSSISGYGNNTFTARIDTLLQKIYPNPEFDLLPGMANNFYSSEIFMTTIMKENVHGVVKALDGGPGISYGWENDTCYRYMIADGCFTNYDYYDGLGGPYFYCQEVFETSLSELVYFKKNGNEWGVPLEYTVNTELQPNDPSDELISVFPNPIRDKINIRFRGNTNKYSLQILDTSGREVTSFSLSGNSAQLDLSHLNKGLLILRFSTSNQSITKKLVKL